MALTTAERAVLDKIDEDHLVELTRSLVRAEGRMVKSPSLFIKDIDFRQDYADFDGFTFPVRMHSQAKARILGRVIVDVVHRDYRPVTTTEVAATPDAAFHPSN